MTDITLDLDNCSFTSLMKRIDKIKKHEQFKEFLVSESCHMNGYHIEIKTKRRLKANAVYNIRFTLGDDNKRIIRDMLGYPKSIMFDYKLETIVDSKGIAIYSFLWEKTPMFLYIRDLDNSWQVINLNKRNSKIFTQKA